MSQFIHGGKKRREIILGESFSSKSKATYYSLRYDFKPASVDQTREALFDVGENNNISITVPHVEGSDTPQTVFKGNSKPCSKECVLIVDNATGSIRLERLASVVNVKKTREAPTSFVHSNGTSASPNQAYSPLQKMSNSSVTPVSSASASSNRVTRSSASTIHTIYGDLTLSDSSTDDSS